MSSRPKRKARASYSRASVERMAASKMYTAKGEPIRDLQAYVSAGGKPRNSAGEVVRNPTAYNNSIEASIRQNTDNPKYLYHFTTPQGAESIAKSGKIQGSSHGLAGPGTYLTAKAPRCNSNKLLENNYGSSTAREASYVKNYVRMDSDYLSAEHVSVDRDVWKVNGKSIDISQHKGFVAERKQENHHGRDGETQTNQGYHEGDGNEYQAAEDYHDDDDGMEDQEEAYDDCWDEQDGGDDYYGDY